MYYRSLRRLAAGVALLCATVVFSPCVFGQSNKSNVPNHVRGRLVVQHRTAATLSEDETIIRTHGAQVARRIESIRVSILELPDAALDQAARRLTESGRFTFVEHDFTARGAILPNDPSFPSQWHLAKIDAPAAWNIATGSTGIPIAIVDSGVDGTHPDLAGKLIGGWNFLGGNTVTADVLGHGTAVAGAAAASTDNGVGVSGVAWRTPLMPLVVLNASDYATYSDVAKAIIYAADHGVRLINASICGTAASSTMQSALDYAWNKGALVFAAAGNQATSALTYPAACARVIAVSSTDSADARSTFSNFGSWITLSAPGSYIVTTNRGGGYGPWSGTSFSAPIAAGVAALVLSVRPAIDRGTLQNILQQTSDDLGTPGFDDSFGYGRVNAYRAVNAAMAISGDVTPPHVTIAAPAEGTTAAGTMTVSGTATDANAVTKCELYVDSVLAGNGPAIFAINWDSRSVGNGSHALEVRCADSAANVGTAGRTVTVYNAAIVDTQAPFVTIITPANGERVVGQEQIRASATDNVGVSQVNIYIDGVLSATSASGSCSTVWMTKRAAWGPHTITAKAWDRTGNLATTSISVYR
ncbi:MAG: S8 family serine peptidase [Bryobacteraceae bacterium]